MRKTEEKDLKFWNLVLYYIHTYNLQDYTAEQNAYEDLGYKPKYSLNTYYP